MIRMKELGNVVMGKDIEGRGMSEWEVWELLNVRGGSMRGGIKRVWKKGIVNECEIRDRMGVWEKWRMEV